jgi:hypothetical protein
MTTSRETAVPVQLLLLEAKVMMKVCDARKRTKKPHVIVIPCYNKTT